MKRPVKVAWASIAITFAQTDCSLANMLEMIDEAAASGVKLVCFPKVGLRGYFTDKERLTCEAQTVDGPACQVFIEAAKRHDPVVSVGMVLREGDAIYNAQIYLDATGPLRRSTQVHLCGPEADLFDPGHDWPVIDLGFAKVGTVICFDAEFPEAAWCLALDGADIIMSFATGRYDSCGRPQDHLRWPDQVMSWAPDRAFENRTFVVAVNYAGDVVDEENICGADWVEPGQVHRWLGISFVVGPSGKMIGKST